MTFPDNVLDPGIPGTPNAPESLLISGVCSEGPTKEIIAISSLEFDRLVKECCK